jgi:hypothetical protein
MAFVPLVDGIMCTHRCGGTWGPAVTVGTRWRNRTAVRVRLGRHVGRPGLAARSSDTRVIISAFPIEKMSDDHPCI